MSRLLRVLAIGFILAALTNAAEAAECKSAAATLSDEVKKFSLVVPKGMEYRAYDDIGCALISRDEECASRQMLFDSNAVVVDYLSGEELPVGTAYFVFKTDVRTPRGFGILAFKDKSQAEKFAADHGKGKVMKWFELVDENLK
ncbi:MAG: nitrous oxide reductase accessory protein NosL [Nitrospirota bacterium]|nr:nitrous oxide reductase accessory protein NosL [Nitrospirota bacterium]